MLTVLSFGSSAFVQMTDGAVFPFDPEGEDFVPEQMAGAGLWEPRHVPRYFGAQVDRRLFPDCP